LTARSGAIVGAKSGAVRVAMASLQPWLKCKTRPVREALEMKWRSLQRVKEANLAMKCGTEAGAAGLGAIRALRRCRP
jgi:hypothetical protein